MIVVYNTRITELSEVRVKTKTAGDFIDDLADNEIGM